jgi:hypothetical protein
LMSSNSASTETKSMTTWMQSPQVRSIMCEDGLGQTAGSCNVVTRVRSRSSAIRSRPSTDSSSHSRNPAEVVSLFIHIVGAYGEVREPPSREIGRFPDLASALGDDGTQSTWVACCLP